jgi:hypothetical protein
MVCDAIGLDNGDYSFAYIARWADGSTNLLKETAEHAVECARVILNNLAKDSCQIWFVTGCKLGLLGSHLSNEEQDGLASCCNFSSELINILGIEGSTRCPAAPYCQHANAIRVRLFPSRMDEFIAAIHEEAHLVDDRTNLLV